MNGDRYDYVWEGSFGDIESDDVDYLLRTNERQRETYKRWHSLTPICATCEIQPIGRNPHGRCYHCECEAGTLPIYALRLDQFGSMK